MKVMGKDFIPESDAEFNLWQDNLISNVEPNAEAWGIPAADITALKSKQTPWTATFAKAASKTNRTSADVRAKNDARKEYESALRGFIAEWLAKNSKVTDSDRERLGITVRSTSRTPVSRPATSPVGTVDFSVRLQHSIHFSDSTLPGKAKPDGVHGAEIWAKVGDAADFSYLATDTRTPYIATYDDGDAGKTVSYRLRWVNTRGEQGPWSSVISAIIAG